MNRLFRSLLIIAVILFGTLTVTRAFFSDTETSTDNILAAGAIDLKIDNESYYNGLLNADTTWELDDLDPTSLFFNFTDIKPDDWGEDTISLRVNDNESWACVDISLTADDDVSSNEPELADGDVADIPEDLFDGELGENVNFIFWVDDGDNVLEATESANNVLAQGPANEVLDDSWTLADSIQNQVGGAVGQGLAGDTTYYIGKAWCFGTLTPSPVADGAGQNPTVDSGILCDGTNLDNTTQTDNILADFSFRAVQHRNNPDFVCNPEPTPPPPVVSCTQDDIQYASSASDNDQGLRKNSTAVLANRSIPGAAFGPPQTTGTPSDAGFPAGSFFSLGFPLSGNTASIVFGFASPFYPNPAGADVQVYEVTGGVYPDEKVKIETASNLLGPWTVALPNPGVRDAGFEIATPFAQYVRLTDTSDIGLFEPTADGYDVDAVKVFCQNVAL